MIRIYTLTKCPYCKDLKDKLTNEGIEFQEYNMDLSENEEIFDKLYEVTGSDSFPMVQVGKNLLVPDDSFNTIDEAVETTKKLLS